VEGRTAGDWMGDMESGKKRGAAKGAGGKEARRERGGKDGGDVGPGRRTSIFIRDPRGAGGVYGAT